MVETHASSQTPFFVLATFLVLLMAWRGWRLGLVRQALSIIALVMAYAVAFFGGRFLIPVLRPIGFPDRVLSVVGGALLGFGVYVVFAAFSGLVFKRTEHQSSRLIRYGFGLSGALLGAVFGLFLVLVSVVGIRVLGSLAEHELTEHSGPGAKSRHVPANPVATRLAEMKVSLEQGAAGTVVEKVDPIPGKVYETLGKVGQIVGNADKMERFIGNPKIRALASNPKIVALQKDPEIAKAAEAQDYMALLRNPRLVEALNDPEVMKLLGTVDFEKALDFALKPAQKPAGR
jgi:hypothetical protein